MKEQKILFNKVLSVCFALLLTISLIAGASTILTTSTTQTSLNTLNTKITDTSSTDFVEENPQLIYDIQEPITKTFDNNLIVIEEKETLTKTELISINNLDSKTTLMTNSNDLELRDINYNKENQYLAVYSMTNPTEAQNENIILVNHAPVSQNLNYETNKNTAAAMTSVTITLKATDEDNDNIAYLIIQGPSNGIIPGKTNSLTDIFKGDTLLFLTKPTFTYTPNIGFVGEDSFTYIAYDGEKYSNVATVKINVKETADTTAPVITIISPRDRTYDDDDVLFKITTNEDVSEAWFNLDGGSRVSMTKVDSRTFTYSARNLDDDSYTITFYAKDLAGNIGSKSVDFEVDTDNGDGERETRKFLTFNGDDLTKKPTTPYIDEKERIELKPEPKTKVSSIYWIILILAVGILILITLILIISRMRNNVRGRYTQEIR